MSLAFLDFTSRQMDIKLQAQNPLKISLSSYVRW